MDFRFTDDQLTLAEGVRDYLAGTHGPEVLRRLDEQGSRDPAIGQGLVDMGLTGVLVDNKDVEKNIGLPFVNFCDYYGIEPDGKINIKASFSL